MKHKNEWIVLIGIMILFSLVTIAELETTLTHEKTYTEYNEKYIYGEIEVTESLVCVSSETTKGETCNHPQTYTQYKLIDTLYVPIESSRIEKLENKEGELEIIKNAYSSDGIMTIFSIPTGDRNFKEFPQCRKYEKDKGVCREVTIQ